MGVGGVIGGMVVCWDGGLSCGGWWGDEGCYECGGGFSVLMGCGFEGGDGVELVFGGGGLGGGFECLLVGGVIELWLGVGGEWGCVVGGGFVGGEVGGVVVLVGKGWLLGVGGCCWVWVV
uniref:Uncharacterized protein n=1 Tax=Knipowitschia caucasica TaxID=637954 RepID=A0AAV2KGP3_KNICA